MLWPTSLILVYFLGLPLVLYVTTRTGDSTGTLGAPFSGSSHIFCLFYYNSSFCLPQQSAAASSLNPAVTLLFAPSGPNHHTHRRVVVFLTGIPIDLSLWTSTRMENSWSIESNSDFSFLRRKGLGNSKQMCFECCVKSK